MNGMTYCVLVCPNGYYGDTSFGICRPCDSNCKNCAITADNCTSCNIGFVL